MAASMVCQYPGCTETASLERCNNKDGRLVCARHRTLRNGSYVCALCDEARAKAEAEEMRTEAIRRRQAADNEVHDFLRFGTIAAGVAGIVMLFFGGGWSLLAILRIGSVITSWVMSSGHRKGPLRDMETGWRAMVWTIAIVGAVIGVPILIIVWLVAMMVGAGVKQAADDYSADRATDRALDRVDRRYR